MSEQIISPHDKGIKNCILKNLSPRDSSWKTSIIFSSDRVEDPLQKVLDAYVQRQVDNAFDLNMNEESKYLFTYTAMHGVGYRYVKEVFHHLKFEVCGIVLSYSCLWYCDLLLSSSVSVMYLPSQLYLLSNKKTLIQTFLLWSSPIRKKGKAL